MFSRLKDLNTPDTALRLQRFAENVRIRSPRELILNLSEEQVGVNVLSQILRMTSRKQSQSRHEVIPVLVLKGNKLNENAAELIVRIINESEDLVSINLQNTSLSPLSILTIVTLRNQTKQLQVELFLH